MIRDYDRRDLQVEVQLFIELLARQQLVATQMVDGRRTGAVNTPLFFAEGDNTVACGESRGEVDMTHLGESMAHGVVDGAFADLSAFDMRDGNAQRQGDGSGRQQFVAVRDEQEQVWTHLPQAVSEA